MNISEDVAKPTIPRSLPFLDDAEFLTIRNMVRSLLVSLRQKGLLLTEKEFKNRDISPVVAKGHDVSRAFGCDCIKTALKIYKLHKIRVPQKFLVLKSRVKHITLSKKLFSKELKVYAEQILEDYRRLSSEEMQELITLVKATGYSDCYRRNLITTKSHVYVVDTELKAFFPLAPDTGHLKSLTNSVEAEDQNAFSEELNNQEIHVTLANVICAQRTRCLGYEFKFRFSELGI